MGRHSEETSSSEFKSVTAVVVSGIEQLLHRADLTDSQRAAFVTRAMAILRGNRHEERIDGVKTNPQ